MKAFIYTGGRVWHELVTEAPQEDDLILAADAGLLTAKALGAVPQILLGDFDSLGEPDVPEGTELIRVPVEKNDTDTQLAVEIALERGADDMVIIGGLSGRLDHTLSTLAVLEDLHARGCRAAVVTDGQSRARYLKASSTLIARSEYRYLSLVAVDEVVKGVTVEGCKYPLKNATLRRRNQFAVSNEITGNVSFISVRKGGVYVIESRDI